jgi:predicted transposase/invertase (TIGR01784 family)
MMIAQFLDPKNDVAFRKIFGSEKNKDILIKFLNDMIVFKEKKPIEEVTFLKPIQDPLIAQKKTSIVDVLCADGLGNTYIVEMQVAKDKGFEKRAQYYAAKAYCSQLDVNGKYEQLKEVIFLAITNFVMFPEKTAYKSDHIILDKETHEHNLKDFSFTFLELPKVKKTFQDSVSMIEKWAYFFNNAKNTTEEEAEILLESTNPLSRAYCELMQFSWTEQEYTAYEQLKKKEDDLVACMDQKLDEGIEIGEVKGIKKGIKIGEAKGIKIGEAKGIKIGEKKAKMQMAKDLLKAGVKIEVIMSASQLSREEIEALK